MADAADELECFPFLGKTIPQGMIDNVLSVCPDVDPKDVAKDLVITGSPMRTINRILDGQFPAVVNIDADVESEPMDQIRRDVVNSTNIKKPAESVDRAKVLYTKDDSSDTDVYTDADSDNDDDIMIINEERKSLFSALKSRLNERESRRSPPKQSKTLQSSVSTTHGASHHVEGNGQGRVTKVNRRSSIIDLSFSDDDKQEDSQDVQNTLHSHATKVQATNWSNCVLEETRKLQRKEGPPKKNKKAAKDYFEKHGKKFVDSSPSDSESSDSDDLPCVLPSFPSCSSTDNYKNSDQLQGSNFEDQEDSQIPAKKKKRSPEEIARQRSEALLKKQAKEHERQAKKEAKDKEQQARKQAREQLKTQKDKDKLLKKADTMNQKLNNRLDGCIKQIVVCIDPEIVNTGEPAEENVLLQGLESLGAGHKIQSQRVPSSITWQRGCVQHDVQAETLQISTKTTFTEENHALLRLLAIKFAEMVSRFRQEMQNPAVSVVSDEETLNTFCERVLNIYPGKIITFAIMGLEKYFRDVKLTQKRQFRSAVLGQSSSDSDNSSGKRRKKANKESGPSVMVSRVDVEEALVDLQIKQPNCRVRMCETEEEFAELLAMFTKAVAEAPFKKKQPEAFSFCVEGEKGSVKVSKDGEGLKKVWQKHFQQLRNVSADMAAAITNVYPSPQSLLQAYKRCSSREEASKLLHDILVRRGAGVLATSRRIGPELSRRVHLLLTSDDGNLSLK